MEKTKKAVIYAKSKLGGQYSQRKRWRNNPYTRDCSSFVWSAFDSAGYQMKNTTSTYEVSDPGFDRLYPSKGIKLGQQLGNINTIIKNGYQARAGDLIFYATVSTTRANKITHVSIVENNFNILHARSAAYGIRRDPITVHGTKIVAITRLKETLDIETELSSKYQKAVCIGNGVNIRKEPNVNSVSVGKLYNGDALLAQPVNDQWHQISTTTQGNNIAGYIYSKFIQ